LRAVEALEHLDTRESRRLLETLAGGAAESSGDAGENVLRQVKAKNLPPIPIIDISTTILTHQWTVDRGFIRKPFDLNAVLEAVWNCLEE
jgi:hypothetical protein